MFESLKQSSRLNTSPPQAGRSVPARGLPAYGSDLSGSGLQSHGAEVQRTCSRLEVCLRMLMVTIRSLDAGYT